MDLWKKYLYIYQYECNNNHEFIEKIKKEMDIIKNRRMEKMMYKDKMIINKDLICKNCDYHNLESLYKNNKLITTRLGIVETNFILRYIFKHINSLNDSYKNIKDEEMDIYMRINAGMYYKNIKDKDIVWRWWINQTIQSLNKSILTSSFHVLFNDILLWSYLDLKGTFYNWGNFDKFVLMNSEDKNILYVGSATTSIQYSYENKIYQKAWKFKISNFALFYVKTPQTTLDMDYPDDNMMITTNHLLKEINENIIKNKINTIILGCGSYGPPLINQLMDLHNNINIMYLGSKCYSMFGLYTSGMPIPIQDRDVNAENWIQVLEKCDERCKNIDKGKYWS